MLNKSIIQFYWVGITTSSQNFQVNEAASMPFLHWRGSGSIRYQEILTGKLGRACRFAQLKRRGFFCHALRLINDGIRAGNNAPLKIKSCSTYASGKNEIKKFVKSLPIWITCILKFFSMIKVLCLREINITYFTYLFAGQNIKHRNDRHKLWVVKISCKNEQLNWNGKNWAQKCGKNWTET